MAKTPLTPPEPDTLEPAAETIEAGGAAPPVIADPTTQTWLTTRASDEFGPRGRFHDLTPAQSGDHVVGENPLLVVPTPAQLARRRS